MKRYLFIIFVLMAVTACKKKTNTNQAAPAPNISVARPIVKDIVLTRDYPGYLGAEMKVELVARVSGTLIASYTTPGARMKKGQLMYVIEPTLYENDVKQAEAQLKTVQAQLDYSRNNHERMSEAIKSDAISMIQLLQAESDMAEAAAAVSNAEAALSTARTNLSYCYIRAPFDGRIDLGNFDIGNYINGGVQPVTLATMYKDDRMFAYFNVADNQWFNMQLAKDRELNTSSLYSKVNVKIGTEGKETHPGVLDYLSPTIELSTGTLNIRATLDNPQGTLKDGTYVSVTLPYGKQEQAILVHDAAIGTDQLGKYLYVVNSADTVQYRHIVTGQVVEDSLRQVISGLSPDEYYVTKALLKVREGMKINPVK